MGPKNKKNKGPKTLINASTQKLPRTEHEFPISKTPRMTVYEDAMKMTPSWRVSFMQRVEPWGWHSVDTNEIQEIHTKLCEYESKTWSEILVTERYRNHRVECHKLCKDAREQLEALGLDDQEQIVSLRLGSTQRVWGILDHHVLHLLWWDPQHLVYPSFKKHT